MVIYVQFSDATEAAIAAYWTTPQDPSVYPNQGEVDSSDARWRTFYETCSPYNQAMLPTPT
jgi:hypothetical protein